MARFAFYKERSCCCIEHRWPGVAGGGGVERLLRSSRERLVVQIRILQIRVEKV